MDYFIVHSNELKRLDPSYYLALQNSNYLKLDDTKFEIFDLGSISTLITKGDSPLWKGNEFQESGVPFLRGKNIKDGKIDFKNIVYISEDVNKKMQRSILNDEYFLLTMAGTLGDTAIFKSSYPESNINQDIAKIKLCDDISPLYVNIYFKTKLAKSQIDLLSNGGTRNHLNFEQIKSFKIILPPKDVRDKIISLYTNAEIISEDKEALASHLLDSINNYIYKELGIKLPKIVEKNCFAISFSEVVKRLDPYYYKNGYTILWNNLVQGKYQLYPLNDLSYDISGGATPEINGDYYTSENTGVPFLRVQNISKYGLVLDDVKYIKPEIHTGLLKRSQLKENDLVLTITGRVGTAAVIPANFEGNINQHSVRIRLKESVDGISIVPLFIATYLNSDIGYRLSNRGVTGGTRPALDYDYIRDIIIPLPPSEVQEQIATIVNDIIKNVKKLKSEALYIRNNVIVQIENILTGEHESEG